MTPRSSAIVGVTKLGRNPGNVILAIAAIAFDDFDALNPETINKSQADVFHDQICIHSSIQAGFKIDADALVSWQTRSEQDWTRAFGGQTPLDITLSRFVQWKQARLEVGATIWIDADCDLPAAAFAFTKIANTDTDVFDNVQNIRDIKGYEGFAKAPPLACPLDKCLRIGSLIAKHAQKIPMTRLTEAIGNTASIF